MDTLPRRMKIPTPVVYLGVSSDPSGMVTDELVMVPPHMLRSPVGPTYIPVLLSPHTSILPVLLSSESVRVRLALTAIPTGNVSVTPLPLLIYRTTETIPGSLNVSV